MQCCIFAKWIHLKGSLLSFSGFKILGSFHSWSCHPCCVLASSGDPHLPTLCLPPRTPPACMPPLCCLIHLTLPLLMQHSRSTLVFKPLIAVPPTSYLLPLYPHLPFMFLIVFLYFLLPLPLLTTSGFFNGMLEAFEPGALKYYTLVRPIPLIKLVSRNLIIVIHLPFSGSLVPLLCNLIAPTPGLPFSLPIPHTLAAASSFLSDRAYLSLNFLPPLSRRLTPTSITEGSTSH